MKIVVDTNIVFSTLLNTNSRLANLLLQTHPLVHFYTCDYLRSELLRHRPKLLKLTKLPEMALTELQSLVTGRISFINEGLLPAAVFRQAEALTHTIDPDDTPFVALALRLDALLWTGDLRLHHGLQRQQFANAITTAELAQRIDDLWNG